MPEPDNGGAPAQDPIIFITVSFNQRSGEIQVTGCAGILPYALGLLETGLVLIKGQYAKAQAAGAPRVAVPPMMMPRKM